MTATDERAAPAGLDGGEPPYAQLRPAWEVKPGWHVQVDGRFLLVERADPGMPVSSDTQVLSFDCGAILTVRRHAKVWTRTPEEQMTYVSSVELPSRPGLGYKPPRGAGPLLTPFSGSAPGRVTGGAR